MKNIGRICLVVLVPATLLVAGCAMDEIIVEEESFIYSETGENVELPVREYDGEARKAHFSGDLQKVDPVVTLSPTKDPVVDVELEPEIKPPGDWMTPEEEVKPRVYKCSEKVNFTETLQYRTVSLVDKNGDDIVDVIAHCQKVCDFAAADCTGFFYLNTSDNGRFCGLVSADFSDSDWSLHPLANEGSQVCVPSVN